MDPWKHEADLVSLPTSWQQQNFFIFSHSHDGSSPLTECSGTGTRRGSHHAAVIPEMWTVGRRVVVEIGSAWVMGAGQSAYGQRIITSKRRERIDLPPDGKNPSSWEEAPDLLCHH